MLTRGGREALKHKVAENNFLGLTEDLMHKEVIDFAIKIYSLLNSLSQQYSSDALIDLVPELTNILNRLDACLKVTEDMTENLKEVYQENNYLKKALENEKHIKKVNLEASLCFEEETEREITDLKSKIAELTWTKRHLSEELQSKNKVIELLTLDREELSHKLAEKETLCSDFEPNNPNSLDSRNCRKIEEDDFHYPKRITKQSALLNQQNEMNTHNRFSHLALDDSVIEPVTVMQVTAQVHHRDSYIPPPKHPKAPSILSNEGIRKRKVMILSDSHGNNLYRFMDDVSKKLDFMVVSKPNAKLKHVVREGRPLIEHFTEKDHVIIIAGTNDLQRNEPSQLTIRQGLNELFSWDIKTNVTVVEIPFRYDDAHVNDNIFWNNLILKKKIQKYKGNLNLSFLEINSFTHRSFYTRHGLHYNSRGKRFISETIVSQINKNEESIHYKTTVNPTIKQQGIQLFQSHKHKDTSLNDVSIRISQIDCQPDETLPQSTPLSSPLRTPGVSFSHSDVDLTAYRLSMNEFPPLTSSPSKNMLCHSGIDSSVLKCKEGSFLEVLIDARESR